MANGPEGFTDREHEGHVGWTIDQLAVHAGEWVRASRPDVVLLMIGTNDVAVGARLESAPARLAQMVRDIHVAAPAARILLSTIPPTRIRAWEPRMKAFNGALPAVVGALRSEGISVTLVHVGDMLFEEDLRDNVHPTAAGNVLLGRAWCTALTQAR
jgi:lysophospholipase L1-like esterase